MDSNKLKGLQKLILDPEWHYVEELLSKNSEPLRDIATIDLTQSAETIKAIVAGRQETLKLIDNFKHEVGQIKNIKPNQAPTSFA